MTRFWLPPAILLLTSCSTIMDRSTQEVLVETPGARESMCILDTSGEAFGGVTYRVFPPEKVVLMKTDEELEAKCFADGFRQKTVQIKPVLSSNTLLNLGNGFVPGFALDEHTNAHYIYPDVIVIDFTAIPFEKAKQPAYALNPATPLLEDIDPKRGGFPAINSSDMEPPAEPDLRQGRAFYSEQPDAPNYQTSKPAPIK